MSDPRDVIATTLYTQSDDTHEVEHLADAILAAFAAEGWTICKWTPTSDARPATSGVFVPVPTNG